MSATLLRLSIAGIACAIAMPAGAQLATEKVLTYAVSKVIAENAYEACAAQGYGVSVHVVGREGEVRFAIRGDNSRPHGFENSRRKAYTARVARIPSADFAKRAETEATQREQKTLPGIIAIGGGLPIKVGNEVIGGVGVSGAPGADKDAACAQVGLDKAADMLK